MRYSQKSLSLASSDTSQIPLGRLQDGTSFRSGNSRLDRSSRRIGRRCMILGNSRDQIRRESGERDICNRYWSKYPKLSKFFA